jgi:hypothetical protein
MLNLVQRSQGRRRKDFNLNYFYETIKFKITKMFHTNLNVFLRLPCYVLFISFVSHEVRPLHNAHF